MTKTVILGITGCIAAYKSCEIVSSLSKLGYDVRVIMTKNACEFVTPLTFETLSKNKVVTTTFEKDREFNVEHISYAKLADVFLVAPATANIIAKIADGIADDMLTTTIMASKAPKIICPAMNTAMYENPLFLQNLDKLRKLGYIIIEPDDGLLACGDVGKGRLAEPSVIVSEVDKLLTPNPDLRGKRILITAGATEEAIDKVRFITNHSSGKMGIALASIAKDRGAEVVLLHGRITENIPKGIVSYKVTSTEDMYNKAMELYKNADIIIKAAAPSDYKVVNYSESKIKDKTLTLKLEKNIDIASSIGKVKQDRKLIIFAAETNDLINYAKEKLEAKNADMVIANDVSQKGAGFNVDTNIVSIIRRDGSVEALPLMKKTELANIIFDRILNL